MGVLHTLAWLVGIVYSTIPSFWLVVHPSARKLGRADQPLIRAGAIWLGMWVAMGALTSPWRGVVLYYWTWSWLVAAPFFVGGFTLYVLAFQRFSADQVLGRTELHPSKHEQRLVTGGIRQYIRHPIYLAHFCELIAWSIGTGMAVLYAMTAFAAITGVFMVRAEDRELEARFGEEFREYRDRVPGLFPRL